MKNSLVIPCYNEAPSLPALIARCERLVAESPETEVVLVDNGSTDGTAAVLSKELRDARIRSVRVDVNRGYGHGILTGLRAARGARLGWTHADLQTDPRDALAGFRLMDASSAPERLFVKGRRHGRPLGDVVFTVGMSLFETALLRQAMWDINAQPTLFHRAFFERWSEPPTDFSLDLFAYALATRSNLEIRRFPVAFGPRAHGRSHWNVDLASKLKFIRRTVSFSLNLRHRL
ncbi:MAG: glycosyltransferase family 2 protein [Sandaracinaceae bacterium]|nr:glycosyltransferase family 2 protein [Myxococcales bacterium]MCB9658312.1 glycosyltransferase family 2 protein [Sandaracinaceae bacterium]